MKPHHQPASRNTDPLSSFNAEDTANKHFRQKHKDIILSVIRKHPGLTSKQMASHCHLSYHQIARRLIDIEGDGLIVRGDGTDKGVVWYPVVGQLKLF